METEEGALLVPGQALQFFGDMGSQILLVGLFGLFARDREDGRHRQYACAFGDFGSGDQALTSAMDRSDGV